jgi:hypothetical protein
MIVSSCDSNSFKKLGLHANIHITFFMSLVPMWRGSVTETRYATYAVLVSAAHWIDLDMTCGLIYRTYFAFNHDVLPSYLFLLEIRVVHGSHSWAIFGSFLISFLISFFRNGLQNETRMNHKMIIFIFILYIPFLMFFWTLLWCLMHHIIVLGDHHHTTTTTTIDTATPSLPHTSLCLYLPPPLPCPLPPQQVPLVFESLVQSGLFAFLEKTETRTSPRQSWTGHNQS